MSFKTISAAFFASVVFVSAAAAAPPAFWHWYHAYSEPMSTCSALLKEVMNDIQKNWDLDGGDVNRYNASFRSGDTRGFLRCLNRGPDSSWVVIIAAGGGSKAKDIFGDMKVVVCGAC